MKASRQENIEIHLSMTLEEAEWLMSFIQNYPNNDEPTKEKEIRNTLWYALNDAGVKLP